MVRKLYESTTKTCCAILSASLKDTEVEGLKVIYEALCKDLKELMDKVNELCDEINQLKEKKRWWKIWK